MESLRTALSSLGREACGILARKPAPNSLYVTHTQNGAHYILGQWSTVERATSYREMVCDLFLHSVKNVSLVTLCLFIGHSNATYRIVLRMPHLSLSLETHSLEWILFAVQNASRAPSVRTLPFSTRFTIYKAK